MPPPGRSPAFAEFELGGEGGEIKNGDELTLDTFRPLKWLLLYTRLRVLEPLRL